VTVILKGGTPTTNWTCRSGRCRR